MAFDGNHDYLSVLAATMSATAVPAYLEGGTPPLSAPTESWLPAPERTELFGWMDHAACRGVGSAEFFGTRAQTARARARCGVCPVAEVCLWWAMVVEADLGYRFGIWGGVAPAVRARIAWVAGDSYARARFIATATRWAQTCLESADTTAVA